MTASCPAAGTTEHLPAAVARLLEVIAERPPTDEVLARQVELLAEEMQR